MAQLSLFTPIIPASSSAATPRRSYTSNSTETDMNMSPMTAALNNLDNDRSAPAEPHNVRDETPPDDRFNAVTFQNALGDARRLMGELANVLGGGALHREPESVMSRLHAQAQRLSGFECPSRRKIGFVGDSGAGKSSLLNSLLDCENLANTASAGAACTCVVTEYHYRQGDDCVIEIERYSLDEIRNQVKDLLLSYRHFHLHRNDLDTRATGEAPDKENEKATENTARLAIDKLKSMFRNHIKDEAFLLANEALDTMYQWVEEAEKLLTTYGENSTGTLDECASTLSRLTSEGPSADDLTIWPFIKKVKVFVDAHILSKGLILVDLPGLRDVNSSRRNITERYVLRCDEIFVVCEMGRVVTDRSVEDVFHLAQQAGISNIGIVCTKSDLFEIEQERNNCRDVQMRRTIEEMISACARDQEIIQRVKDDLRNGDGSDAEEMTVEQKDAQTTLLWKKMRADIKKYLMAIRAQRIGNQLQEKYGNLAVFFVSKTIYWEARREPRDRAVPRLEVSGILAVRRHCMGMVSESQFALASRFLHSDVDALLGDIELWVRSGAESTTAERTRLVREALEMVERRMRTSYAAFCSNFGHHYTEAVRDHCWNEKIMKAMNESMEPSWKALSTSTKTRMEGIKNIVAQFINWAVDHLYSLEILTDVLLSREHLLVAEIEDAWNDFDNNLRLLRRDATKPMRTSLIGQGMEDAYRAASHESGRGCHNRRKSHITNAASSPQLFLKVLEDSRKEFRGLTSTLENRVRETVAEHAKSIKETLDIVRGENAAREADRDPAYRARVEEEVGRVKKAMRGLVTAGGI
ncbi:hypothetical protein F5Y10DRAFT_289396 [Nemania abortiva]|nr:hypothetical protein F5Y10DRAFT_289396 [Nemania abortiva]